MTILILMVSSAIAQTRDTRIDAPRFWNDRELADWALPVAGLNVLPSHYSEADYYAAPDGEWVRTYPVYFPGLEPDGYWDMIQKKKPEPLITPGARTAAEWISAGKQVFQEIDAPGLRSTDPQLIAVLRSAAGFSSRGGHPQRDGTVMSLRWVPTSKGLALGLQDCGTCHSRVMPDGSILHGAQYNDPFDGVLGQLVSKASVFFFPGDTPGMAAWRHFGVPWVSDDIHEGLKGMTRAQINAVEASNPVGTIARFNGSPYYPTQVPDLIGIKDRKYIDHTATHQLRGPADLMRYAAVVSCCDSAEFGSHRLLPGQKILYKIPDHLAFALAQYVFSLEPPANPNMGDPRAVAGKQVFEREACGSCHTPPLYTNNKLTLATGYKPPDNHPNKADIMPVSVGTDPNLALKTRKGTGLYKVPSLKGIWYRGLLSHDGSVATLEDWFDPARLREDYVPTGFKGYNVTRRAVPGHEFGLTLSPEDKVALIAFLRTL